jgi:hypothetical protein
MTVGVIVALVDIAAAILAIRVIRVLTARQNIRREPLAGRPAV